MPWKVISPMDAKTEFVLRAMRQDSDFSALCQEFGISRKTGYKWKERFLRDGMCGLYDRSRRPESSPNQLDEDQVCRIVRLKQSHPHWGPRKLREVFARQFSAELVPSESTFKRVLDKAGLVEHRRQRKSQEAGTRLTQPIAAERPNHVWTVDFKGWWYTLDRRRFEPLTIRDDYSRYILCARALGSARTDVVREEFRRAFERNGLPEIIRSDNGAPFAAESSPLGLTRLSAWWLTLGIDLDRIRPGKPQENGAHERMHRDIASEVESSAEVDLVKQQATLDVWVREFNNERPHESLGMKLPREVYAPSLRVFDGSEVQLVYPVHYQVRTIRRVGTLRISYIEIFISEALAGLEVGLESIGETRYTVWFCRLPLGELDLTTRSFRKAPGS
jgi:transposase InsO family protein